MLCIVMRSLCKHQIYEDSLSLRQKDENSKALGSMLQQKYSSLMVETPFISSDFHQKSQGEVMDSGCLPSLRTTSSVKSSLHDKTFLSFMKMSKAKKHWLHSYYCVCYFPDSPFRGLCTNIIQRKNLSHSSKTKDQKTVVSKNDS